MTEELKKSFIAFASHGKGGKQLSEMDGKNFSKLCKDCKVIDGKKCTSTDVDIEFSKVKAKTARVITFAEFQKALEALAQKRFSKAEDAYTKAVALISGKTPSNLGVTKTSKTGGVEKMTDTSQYTGAHKERFGADGKGKGLSGREDLSENTGYVGNYKGDGTYEDKVSK